MFNENIIHSHDHIVLYVNFFKSAKGKIDPLNSQLKNLTGEIAGLEKFLLDQYELIEKEDEKKFIYLEFNFFKYKKKKIIHICGNFSKRAFHTNIKLHFFQNQIWSLVLQDELINHLSTAIIFPFFEKSFQYYDFVFKKYPRNCNIIIPPAKTDSLIQNGKLVKLLGANLTDHSVRQRVVRENHEN